MLVVLTGDCMPNDLDSESVEPRRTTQTLMPEVYEVLRELAFHRTRHQRPGQTISGTELVHEAYLRLQQEGSGPKWANRQQFFVAAAEAMRRILIDRIRAKARIKRGGGRQRLDLDQLNLSMPAEDQRLIDISEALDSLTDSDPASADLVKLRFFAGMTLEQIAEVQEVSVRTITRRWTYARAWLADYLED